MQVVDNFQLKSYQMSKAVPCATNRWYNHKSKIIQIAFSKANWLVEALWLRAANQAFKTAHPYIQGWPEFCR